MMWRITAALYAIVIGAITIGFALGWAAALSGNCASNLTTHGSASANTANSGGDQSGKSNNHDGEVSK